MRRDEITRVLGMSKLFGALTGEMLARVVEEAATRRYRRGDLIFNQGDSGDALYVVASGVVKVSTVSEDGGEVVFATLCQGDTFGELAVIDGGPRSAAARAIEATELVTFHRDAFIRMLHAYPLLTAALHRSLGALLRRTLEQASDLVFLDLPGRLAKLLLKLARESGLEGDDGLRLDLNMTQGTLAGMVGGSRPTVNQILRSFEARGYLQLEGRSIVIKEPAALRRRSTP
jgi:CRP/FNR family transcriptional regulator, cyclic AMP receptor protein